MGLPEAVTVSIQCARVALAMFVDSMIILDNAASIVNAGPFLGQSHSCCNTWLIFAKSSADRA